MKSQKLHKLFDATPKSHKKKINEDERKSTSRKNSNSSRQNLSFQVLLFSILVLSAGIITGLFLLSQKGNFLAKSLAQTFRTLTTLGF